ncbi:MAG: hypothetical protein K0S38_681 [Candidatus Paceibacter sp.]|jgi:hypothetical protein|nr:hypothetical protein [Candidatus Paceibacter sp.]
MFSLFKKPEEEIVAVFDIGNGSIGGSLVKFSKYDHPIILYTHREPLTYIPHATPKHLVGGMLKLLKSVASHLAKDGLMHIKTSPFGGHRLRDAHCVFASPWYISQTKVVKTTQEKPFTIVKDTLNDLVKKEQEEFNAAIKEGKYAEVFGPDAMLLEKRVINIRVNGYAVDEPIGKQGRELELTLFSSFISKEILSEVENVLHASFAVRNIHHYSYAYVAWNGTTLMFPDIHDYFFVDVSGETTDISLIVKDILVETISFPIGRSTLLRRVVKEMEISPDVALSYLTMNYAGTLEKNFSEKLTGVLKPLEEEWRAEIIKILTNLRQHYRLPRTTFLTSDSDTAGFFNSAVSKTLPVELNIPQSSLAVTFLSPDKVHPHVFELEGVVHDSFIGIESVFLNALFKNNQ